MKKDKLSKSEQVLFDLYKDNPDYTLHRCDQDGLHAHRNDTEYQGCFYCKKKFPEFDPKTLTAP